jgi:hypothetical protein
MPQGLHRQQQKPIHHLNHWGKSSFEIQTIDLSVPSLRDRDRSSKMRNEWYFEGSRQKVFDQFEYVCNFLQRNVQR